MVISAACASSESHKSCDNKIMGAMQMILARSRGKQMTRPTCATRCVSLFCSMGQGEIWATLRSSLSPDRQWSLRSLAEQLSIQLRLYDTGWSGECQGLSTARLIGGPIGGEGDAEAIVCKLDVWRQCWLRGGVGDIVCEMDESRVARCDACDEFDCLVERKVGWVRPGSQCAEDEQVEVLELGDCVVGHGAEIGAVGEGADAKA